MLGLGLGLQKQIMMAGKMQPIATFTRNSPAYLSDGTQVAANKPRFEPGKFGKAIMVEEGTTNLQPDPNFDNGMTGKKSYDWGDSGTVTASNGICTMDTSDSAYPIALIVPQVAITADTGAHTVSVKCRSANGKDAVVLVHMGVSYKSLGVAPASGEWVILSATYNNGEYTTKPAQHIRIEAGQKLQIDWIQTEQKPYATSFIDDTRSPESLTIPTAGVLNPQEGTVEFWVKPLVVGNWNNFFFMILSNGRFLLFFDSTGLAKFDYGPTNSGIETPSGIISANNWHHIVLRWSATTDKQALFVNGVKYEQDLPNGVATSFPETAPVVHTYSAYIDDLRISSRARSDEEILAAYQSGQPLQWDEWTTYKADFDGKIR